MFYIVKIERYYTSYTHRNAVLWVKVSTLNVCLNQAQPRLDTLILGAVIAWR
jgi:hypothetical protein